jgi:hypothetical protein
MDVVLREDANRIRKVNASSIMTSIRYLVLNLFQKEPPKLTLAKKSQRPLVMVRFGARCCFTDSF